jgi:hypothetical protein
VSFVPCAVCGRDSERGFYGDIPLCFDCYINRPDDVLAHEAKVRPPMSLVVHCQKAPYDVYIGRGQGSIFGNPFTHKEGTQAEVVVASRAEAIQAFRDWLAGAAWQDVEPERRQAILDALPTLKGKVLGCWCAPLACHGDVLAELANGKTAPKLPIVAPGNIFSGERSARTVLTNPTELARKKGNLRHSYPVTIDGVTYPDAEEAYQRLKQGLSHFADMGEREALCVRVIEAKLRQHPQLAEFITVNSGVQWLTQCRHFTGARTLAFSEWEGVGYESAFICCLIRAYRTVQMQPA